MENRDKNMLCVRIERHQEYGTEYVEATGEPAKHVACAGIEPSVDDYAGRGLDERYEDDCARRCGLL